MTHLAIDMPPIHWSRARHGSSCCVAPIPIVALVLIACHGQVARATPEPNVATRHAPGPTAPPSTAPPSSSDSPAQRADPGQAFDPPVHVRLPNTLRGAERVPLLLVLHGYGVSSSLLIAKAGLDQIADQKKFAYLAPEGNRDRAGRPFWNAGESCCDLDHQRPDDLKRLRDLLAEGASNTAIDPRRVFVIGYSNGGFMAQRLACDSGERLAGVISVAGAAPSPDLPCTQSSALSFVEIHGDADPIVHYDGGTVFDRFDVARHSSAPDTVAFWAKQLSCAGPLHEVSQIDLEPNLPGRETSVRQFDSCHGSVELWIVKGGGHYVALQAPALEAIWSFVQSHPKRAD